MNTPQWLYNITLKLLLNASQQPSLLLNVREMPSNSTMGLLRLLLQLHLCIAVMVVGTLKPAESTLVIRFDQAPLARSRFSTAVFRYSVERPDGSNACRNNGCSIYCEVGLLLIFFSS